MVLALLVASVYDGIRGVGEVDEVAAIFPRPDNLLLCSLLAEPLIVSSLL